MRTNKNDAADAEAIREAVTRPTMRFAPVKGVEQQSVLALHRARELLVRQRTMLINAVRGHRSEFGIIVTQRPAKVRHLLAIIADPDDGRLPALTAVNTSLGERADRFTPPNRSLRRRPYKEAVSMGIPDAARHSSLRPSGAERRRRSVVAHRGGADLAGGEEQRPRAVGGLGLAAAPRSWSSGTQLPLDAGSYRAVPPRHVAGTGGPRDRSIRCRIAASTARDDGDFGQPEDGVAAVARDSRADLDQPRFPSRSRPAVRGAPPAASRSKSALPRSHRSDTT